LWGESIVILAMLILFIGLALSEPDKLDGSYLFQTFYIVLAGNVYLATESLNITHLMFNAWRRVVQSKFTPEILVLLLTFAFRWFREMSLTVAIWPGFKDIGDWIFQIPYVASYRAITIVGATGTLIIAVRALLRKEVGIIEMERVQEE
jgi:hypothetical protein